MKQSVAQANYETSAQQDKTRADEDSPLGRVSLAVGDIRAVGGETSVKARRLRELAAWYRSFAARAGNPVIWEARLLTAEDLDAEAGRIEQRRISS